MAGEDYDGFGADLMGDFLANFLEFDIGWVRGFFYYCWAAVGQEVDGEAGHGCCIIRAGQR